MASAAFESMHFFFFPRSGIFFGGGKGVDRVGGIDFRTQYGTAICMTDQIQILILPLPSVKTWEVIQPIKTSVSSSVKREQ